MNAILKEEPPELNGANSKIPHLLEKIVRRCLEKKPEQRFQSASDLGFALDALSTAQTPSDASATPAKRPLPKFRLKWLVRLCEYERRRIMEEPTCLRLPPRPTFQCAQHCPDHARNAAWTSGLAWI